MTDIVVLGGGFGGLAAAHTLRSALGEDDTVTVVDRRDRFFMGFAKLWDLAGVRALSDGTAPLASLERHGIRFVQATVRAIDPDRLRVITDMGTLRADGLVVALGARPAAAHLELLTGDGAHDLYDAAALPPMRAQLGAIDRGEIVVAILGGPFKCPPAPYEAALLIDERLRQRGVRDRVGVSVVTPQPMTLPAAGPDASRYVADHLAERDVRLTAGSPVVAVDGEARVLRLGDGTEVPYALLFGVPADAPLPVAAPLAGASGWIEPDRHSLATGYDRVYAVGDCTHIPTATGALPRAGVFAALEGTVAARNLLADLGSGEPDRFDGHGYCFLELPDRRVAFVEGDFYGEPPQVAIAPADEQQYERKLAFERDHLARWLG